MNHRYCQTCCHCYTCCSRPRVTFSLLCVVALFATQMIFGLPTLNANPVPLNQQTVRTSPSWLTEGVIYQINPRAFTEEGTLVAAEKKLPHLAELGVTIVYLCPVFVSDDDMNQQFWSPRQKKSGQNNPCNPYRMKDYYNVDPEYGTNDDLKQFIRKAHDLKMRVMLDMVYLHCGPTAVFIKSHPDFVKRDKDGNILNAAWAFPGLNYQSAQLREYLINNMEYWVRDFDVDSFRMDVADGIALDFWVEARKRVEKIRPDVVFLSEGSRTQDQLYAFDINYAFPHFGTLNKVFMGQGPAKLIAENWNNAASARPVGARFMRYFDNHDISNDDYTNRAEKRYGFEGANAAFVLLYTLDGTPMIYCGQEVCDTNRHSIFGRMPIAWSNESGAQAQARQKLLKHLANMRKTSPALTRGTVEWLTSDCPESVLSLLRTDAVTGQTILAVINVTKSPVKATVELPKDRALTFTEATLLTNGTRTGNEFELPAWGYVITELKNE